MSKRKNSNEINQNDNMESDDMEEEDKIDEIQVDFDFFDPKETDFHSIKNFINVLFGKDRIDSSDLADIIVKQPLIGTTIKTVDEDDALTIFTVLNMNVHKDKTSIIQIKEYLLNSTRNNIELHNLLNNLFNSNDRHTGLLLNERLINMPVQVAPPMYKMLGEEIEWAIQDNEPYNLEYFMIISKTYKEIQAQDDFEGGQESQQQKRNRNEPNNKVFYCNLEDEIISQHANFIHDIEFINNQVPDSKRAFNEFGIINGRKLLVFHKSKYNTIVDALQKAIPSPQ